MRVSILSVLAFLSPLAIAGPVAVESSADGLQERQTPSYDCLNLDGAKPRRWLENPEESFYRNFVSLGVYLWSWGRNTETAEINCIDVHGTCFTDNYCRAGYE
ncbi:hypothetical protein IWW34DRAFT_874228 [Fusarium oxysporum f. sp. albedinis]|nr:hypothetical protein IWW34DRAFT_874228 [Fusarium oxysporum f. sp. albedinis]